MQMCVILAAWTVLASQEQAPSSVIIRPTPIDDVLVNPGMGIQTFQRFNGDALNPDSRWSEVGPEQGHPPAARRPDFPLSSVAYLRWFWAQLEPEAGKYRWEIIDGALARARQTEQTLMIRLMPYDADNPLPLWYRESGARRINRGEDQDGATWSPDADDPQYAKSWSALVRAVGQRYDGHPSLEAVDISTVGYWGEGWGPYLPSETVRKALIDAYLEAFTRTPLLMYFDDLLALRYGVERGAGWRVDCWGDLGGRGANFTHMLDRYPQQLVRAGAQDAWRRAPVSLEVCGTPALWQQRGYGEAELDDMFAQALRWHASTINLKSTAIPRAWRAKFDQLQKRLGYRFVLRRLEYPRTAQRGAMLPIAMWWLNAGVAPPYRDLALAIELRHAKGRALLRTEANLRTWLPGDAIVEQSLYVPHTLPAGEHRVRIAVVDPRTMEPIVRLAIAGRGRDGWYDLGSIELQ